jgi:hypothetical protein
MGVPLPGGIGINKKNIISIVLFCWRGVIEEKRRSL